MYAIIEDGSRQYHVSEGDLIRVDFRRAEGNTEELEGKAAGSQVEFSRVLFYRNGDETRIGQPLLEGLRVVGEVVNHPSTKTYIGKFRKRKNYRRLRGHRQHYTAVRIKHILLPGAQAPSAATAPAAQPQPQPETPPQTQQPAAQPQGATS